MPKKAAERLRRAITELNGDGRIPTALMDAVLEDVLGLGRALEPETGTWLKGNTLSSEWSHRSITGITIKPQRVWQGENGAELPVFVDTERRIGIGRGRRMPAHVVEWLRATERPLAVLTNGRQWRLIHASLDADAFAEWDTSLWFEEGEPGPQVTALRALLDRERLTPKADDEPAPLLAAIADSRKGQGELSAALGERVRQAVELLIRRVFPEEQLPNELDETEATRKQIYRAATRAVMRMVVVLFAEARDDLLPRSNPTYHLSYGLQGLREALQQAGAGTKEGLARLAHRRSAWPRVLSLFRLIYYGSPHKDLTLPRYGGGLFEPGNPASADALERALEALEDPARGPHDADVYRMLDLLCVTETRVRQGTSYKRIPMPVNFADLSSEYIGILYEGLLDYELRRAAPDDPMVFLSLGDQPTLPLSRLEAMSADALSSLVEKLRVKASKATAADSDDEDDEEAEGIEVAEADANEAETEAEAADADTQHQEEFDDARRAAEDRALAWARVAVTAARIVKRPRSKKEEALAKHKEDIEAAARVLIARTILPGEWFLVRWGGTRKGAGTFYTRPGLAVPTVHRTLRHLAYDPSRDEHGKTSEEASPTAWTPKKPEVILDLKVCDPSMGSASFLVASLRFLTDALYASLHYHGRIAQQGEKALVTLAEGKPSEGNLCEETLPCRPDDEDFEPRLRAILKRYIVERCLYGVDIDPLAVELARLSLWVETLDRELPFEFLDHKLRPGNSLVGCWFDRFRDYPILAWDREGGDKNHSHGTHFDKSEWTKAIKAERNGVIKRELIELIDGQMTIDDKIGKRSPEEIHDEAAEILEKMHSMTVQSVEERAQIYQEKFHNSPTIRHLRRAFDIWCAVWFWPAERLHLAPTPQTQARSSPERDEIIESLADQYRFFHWEIEFPDVFCRGRTKENNGEDGKAAVPSHAGFDAIVGNPPWEIQKPNSKEFFSNLDPLYRGYRKADADQAQIAIFRERSSDEREWLEYNYRFKALANWNKNVSSPFGDGTSGGAKFSFGRGKADLHSKWTTLRTNSLGYSDPRHPYRYQGSADLNTYKMFLEQNHALLRPGGHLGVLTPSGIYTDKGATELRKLFLDCCSWERLYAFQNERFVFPAVHHSFKISALWLRKGGKTPAISTRFRVGPGDSPTVEEIKTDSLDDSNFLLQPKSRIDIFSPRTKAILEIRSERDLHVVNKLYRDSVLLGDSHVDQWRIKYAREFDMTNDSKRFSPRPRWEKKGYAPDEYGRWIKYKGKPNARNSQPKVGWIRLRDGEGAVAESDILDIALPLYQGVMVQQFDFAPKGWVRGTGLRAQWDEIPPDEKHIRPQFLMARADASAKDRFVPTLKPVMRRIARATDSRTIISCLVQGMPCGDKASVLMPESPIASLALASVLNSFAFDWLARVRVGGTQVDWHIIAEMPLPFGPTSRRCEQLARLTLRLNGDHPMYASAWSQTRTPIVTFGWKRLWARTAHERLRIRCMVDAIVALTFGLDPYDLKLILEGCDHPRGQLSDGTFNRSLDPKGFWRIDRDKDPELRHPVLTQVAFNDLTDQVRAESGDVDRGVEAFLGLNGGDGWMLPETLRLADFSLGHDERAKEARPVRQKLGNRFFPWQIEQSDEDSWEECRIHARNVLGEKHYATLELDPNAEATHRPSQPKPRRRRQSKRTSREGQQDLFPEEFATATTAKRKDQ